MPRVSGKPIYESARTPNGSFAVRQPRSPLPRGSPKESLGHAQVPLATSHPSRTAGLRRAWRWPRRPRRPSDLKIVPARSSRGAAPASNHRWVSISFMEASIRLRRRRHRPSPNSPVFARNERRYGGTLVAASTCDPPKPFISFGAARRSSLAGRCPGRSGGRLGRGYAHARRRAWQSGAG